MHKFLPSPETDSTKARAEEEQSRWFGDGSCISVHRPGLASAAGHGWATEYVGDEEVPGSIRGFQLSKRRIGDDERERIHRWGASPVAVRGDGAFDRGGESPCPVGHDGG